MYFALWRLVATLAQARTRPGQARPGSVGGDSRNGGVESQEQQQQFLPSISVRGVSKCAMSALPRCLFPTRFYSFQLLLLLFLFLSFSLLFVFLSSFPPLATSTLHSSDVIAAGAASSAATLLLLLLLPLLLLVLHLLILLLFLGLLWSAARDCVAPASTRTELIGLLFQ